MRNLLHASHVGAWIQYDLREDGLYDAVSRVLLTRHERLHSWKIYDYRTMMILRPAQAIALVGAV